MGSKVRNSNIEVLRFVLMSFILVWHTIVHGYDFKNMGTEDFLYEGNIPLTFFLLSLTAPATYCFVFISGYFGMHFSLKKLLEMILWCLLTGILVMIVRGFCLGKDVELVDVVHSLFPIASVKWWFMTAFVQLYILSPFLNHGMKQLSENSKVIILSLLFLLSFFQIILGKPNAGSSLWGLIFVYLWGGIYEKTDFLRKNSLLNCMPLPSPSFL